MTDLLKQKIEYSIQLLKKAEKLAIRYDREDGFFLAFSGGKDSQALYHIAEMAGVKFKAHFSPTTVDPPQLIKFIRRNYPDVEFAKVKKNIYQVAVEKQILPSMRIRWCCAEFKENAGAGKVTLIGIRHEESARRSKRKEVEVSGRKFSGYLDQFEEWSAEQMKKKYKNLNQDQFSYDKEKEIRCINGKDSILISPIIDWTERDVWEFLNDVVKVPHCELYDKGYKRIGCILCPMSNPKQKRREMKDFPYVKEKWLQAIAEIRRSGGYYKTNLSARHGTPTDFGMGRSYRVYYDKQECSDIDTARANSTATKCGGGKDLPTQSCGKPSTGSEQQLQRKSGGWRKDNRGIWKGDFP